MSKNYYGYGYNKSNVFTDLKLNSLNVINPNLKLYEDLLKICSPSKEEFEMNNFIYDYVEKHYPNAIIEYDECGNIYITKGELLENEYYPCIVAHQDEVHNYNSYKNINKIGDFYIGFDVKTGNQCGIGADDKNGIFIGLVLLDYFDVIKLFFPVQEEIGYVGSSCADIEFFNNVGYLIQPDRHGNSDLISYTNGISVSSCDFLIDIEHIMKNYGYSETSGIGTDIGCLVKRKIGISACNVSCGYWDEHMDEEKTHIPSLINSLNFIYYIIKQCGYNRYEYNPNISSDYELSKNYNWYKEYVGDWYDEDDYNKVKKNNNYIKSKYDDFKDDYSPCSDCESFDCMRCQKFLDSGVY